MTTPDLPPDVRIIRSQPNSDRTPVVVERMFLEGTEVDDRPTYCFLPCRDGEPPFKGRVLYRRTYDRRTDDFNAEMRARGLEGWQSPIWEVSCLCTASSEPFYFRHTDDAIHWLRTGEGVLGFGCKMVHRNGDFFDLAGRIV
jgi:hypothetical protein